MCHFAAVAKLVNVWWCRPRSLIHIPVIPRFLLHSKLCNTSTSCATAAVPPRSDLPRLNQSQCPPPPLKDFQPNAVFEAPAECAYRARRRRREYAYRARRRRRQRGFVLDLYWICTGFVLGLYTYCSSHPHTTTRASSNHTALHTQRNFALHMPSSGPRRQIEQVRLEYY